MLGTMPRLENYHNQQLTFSHGVSCVSPCAGGARHSPFYN